MSLGPARVRAYVGLGANLGDARGSVLAAWQALAELPRTRAVARSALYCTAPIDATGPDFINAVAALDTALDPLALLDALQALEQRFGRERPYRNAPRTLDLDLLLHGDAQWTTERLQLPHPRAHQRAFVLVPLLALDPQLYLPGLGLAADWLAGVADQPIERLPEPA